MIEGDFKREGGRRTAHQLLALSPEQRPSAVVASNNFMGVGLIEALREARLKVPDDIAVVCIDDIDLASALDPFLTVAAQPARTFGTVATQLLIERLEGSAGISPRKVVLPPELIVRVSCGTRLPMGVFN